MNSKLDLLLQHALTQLNRSSIEVRVMNGTPGLQRWGLPLKRGQIGPVSETCGSIRDDLEFSGYG